MTDLNLVPPGHTRLDFDFTHDDGTVGPIRITADDVPEIWTGIPAAVWCMQHGWESELTEAAGIPTVRVGADGQEVAR